ncbi:LTA synthase family protein [Streptococcus chenjunshii]
MKKVINKFLAIMSSRLGFVLTLLLFYWLKNLWAYNIDFSLDVGNLYQIFLTVINPIPIGLLVLGLPLYITNTKVFYTVEILLYVILNFLLLANVIYFSEFTDFITVSTMLASGSASAGLGDSALNLLKPSYIIYILDLVFLIYVFIRKQIETDRRSFNKRAAFAVTALSGLFFSINLFLAEVDRPQLLTRGFSNTYLVRAIGLPAFTVYSANQTYQAQKERSEATADKLAEAETYISDHYAKPDAKYYGIAKNRNVIMLHLESFQQFLIDYKLNVNGSEHEVTPFINSLYHSQSTISFSNFFHQVKAGKTSDAETMMETSLFGLNTGSYMVNYGGDNTAYAAPSILAQNGDYTSAVFHGNVGSFWNRNNTYKQWGYNYFFDSASFSEQTKNNSFQYGLNDKYMFADSIKYLEQLQQPFYAKYITVSNHYPYTSLAGESDEEGFPLADTGDETINGYFATANYLDASVEAFFKYLQAAGIYDNSIIVLYGDHYGISNSRNTSLASLLGKDPETWTEYDNAMLQRVPYMIHIPGYNQGFISDTYGGEIDSLPTLLHLLGIDTSQYIQLGQDLLSPDNDQIVSLRTSGYYITPEYTSYSGRTYFTQSGEEITNPDEGTAEKLKEIRDTASAQLSVSDSIQTGDLLRFYSSKDLQPTDASKITYTDQLKQMESIAKDLGNDSTSIFSRHGNQTTQDFFQAPSYTELHGTSPSASSSSSSSSE